MAHRTSCQSVSAPSRQTASVPSLRKPILRKRQPPPRVRERWQSSPGLTLCASNREDGNADQSHSTAGEPPAGSPPRGIQVNRRQALCVPPVGLLIAAAPASASQAVRLAAEWETESFAAGTEFSLDAYKSMLDDEARTPLFQEAIRRRLKGREGELSVVDIGTGPFAVLAIAAAQAGARQVYAVEADPEAARLAREAIAKSGVPPGRIQVVEGLSTEVELPEKVDLMLAEVVGSVATEEGAYRTVADAQQRLLKAPQDPYSYIPCRVQTLMAPAAYAFHYLIAAEGRKAAGLLSEDGPLRLNCLDQSLALLDDPQVVEDFRYSDAELPGPGEWRAAGGGALHFSVSPQRLRANTDMFVQSLGFDGVPLKDARAVSEGVAKGFSGVALWPRLELDPAGELVVEARAAGGGAQRSHWQTVLPLMAKAPLPLQPGDSIDVSASAVFADRRPTTYRLTADIRRG